MAKQLPKRDLENVGLGVTGACVALVTLVVAALIFMVAQKGLSAFLKDGVSVVEFFTGTKWDLANTAENGLPYTGALPLIVTSFAVMVLSTLIALPIVLIIINSVCSVVLPADNFVAMFFAFVGNNNVALFIAMLVTGVVLHKYLVPSVSESVWKYIDKSSDSMGNILMVISCGNCFGAVLQASGLGDALVDLLSRVNIPLVLLAFVLAMIIRAAVGSATVAMLTTVSIVGPTAVTLGLSPVIVGLAICAGTVGLTLPTDAAF